MSWWRKMRGRERGAINLVLRFVCSSVFPLVTLPKNRHSDERRLYYF
jgi:hypothetical protein